MEQKHKPRLGKEDWFRMGLEALTKTGPEALKAARLARMLGVTTGSFYWHFSGLAEFRSGLLEYWKEDVVDGLIRAAKASAPEPSQVLPELRKRILESGAYRYDGAMRSWAGTDHLVQDTVRLTDEVRTTFLMETLCKSGMSEDEALDRANLIGAAWRGSQELGDPDYRMKLIGIAASDQRATPKTYLKAVRLNAVRRQLRRAERPVVIADVANRWGFWHMGQFAADYRRLFGELPSQTQTRAQATP